MRIVYLFRTLADSGNNQFLFAEIGEKISEMRNCIPSRDLPINCGKTSDFVILLGKLLKVLVRFFKCSWAFIEQGDSLALQTDSRNNYVMLLTLNTDAFWHDSQTFIQLLVKFRNQICSWHKIATFSFHKKLNLQSCFLSLSILGNPKWFLERYII